MTIRTRLITAVVIAAMGLRAPCWRSSSNIRRRRKATRSTSTTAPRSPIPIAGSKTTRRPQTAAWVEAQNKVTFPYLEAIPYRQQLQARVKQLSDYEKYSSPSRKGPYYFFSKNEGLQDQSVLYIQKGLEGTPEVLIDPNKWEGGGTTRLGAFAVSTNAKYAVYGISKSGSDWQQYKVMELATKKTLPDTVDWVKVSGVAWHGDGFYYSRYPEPGQGQVREGGDQRGPPRLLPQGRHAAVAGPPDLPGRRRTRSASTSSRRPKTSASRC